MEIVVNGVIGVVHGCADESWGVLLQDGRWMLFGPEVVRAYQTAGPADQHPDEATYVDGPRGPVAGRPVARDDSARVAHAVRSRGEVFVNIRGARSVAIKGKPYDWAEDLPVSPYAPGAQLAHAADAVRLGSPSLGRDVWVSNLRLAKEKAGVRLARAKQELEHAQLAFDGAASRLLAADPAANPSTTSPCASADTSACVAQATVTVSGVTVEARS